MSEDGEYECSACGRSFSNEEELRRHVHDVGLVD
ncbi:C2H2-type zinc finger protein [Halomarina halobia]|uniref:C2H2-type zinc finger protein n=1 Tax=Halomarina halobia TaxID=3033386 RepID=A0ABD6A5N4_9EURY|nr:C2H2-type zinc finger protein [Halomarina sp. PSR21]